MRAAAADEYLQEYRSRHVRRVRVWVCVACSACGSWRYLRCRRGVHAERVRSVLPRMRLCLLIRALLQRCCYSDVFPSRRCCAALRFLCRRALRRFSFVHPTDAGWFD